MKKLLFFALLTFGIFVSSNAQELGVRFGDVTGGNVALDALFTTSDFSMVHADVSFGNGGVGVDLLWDFVYRPLGDIPMNWYLGAGPVAFVGNDFILGGAGELGLAYKIPDVPISISADWRPTFVLIDTSTFVGDRFGLNLRYVFP